VIWVRSKPSHLANGSHFALTCGLGPLIISPWIAMASPLPGPQEVRNPWVRKIGSEHAEAD
jgi:hypothetical protein